MAEKPPTISDASKTDAALGPMQQLCLRKSVQAPAVCSSGHYWDLNDRRVERFFHRVALDRAGMLDALDRADHESTSTKGD